MKQTITNLSLTTSNFLTSSYAETGKFGGSKYVGVQDRALKLYPDQTVSTKLG